MQTFEYQIFLDRLITISLAAVAAIIAAGLTFVLIYLVVIYFRLKKREEI